MYHKFWDGTNWGPSRDDWEALSGTFESSPTVASWGPNRLDLFGLGTDNSMYHLDWDGTSWGPSVGWEGSLVMLQWWPPGVLIGSISLALELTIQCII
jgi:hypothetical protein